ncbi:hypothetical protein T439DRAFT_325131, partial [Meredithblackwellia eburnea MCA 4105]
VLLLLLSSSPFLAKIDLTLLSCRKKRGTNSIALPSAVAQAIYALIPNSRVVQSSVQYPLPDKSFNGGVISGTGGYCLGNAFSLSSTSTSNVWIIGTTFLMAYYCTTHTNSALQPLDLLLLVTQIVPLRRARSQQAVTQQVGGSAEPELPQLAGLPQPAREVGQVLELTLQRALSWD